MRHTPEQETSNLPARLATRYRLTRAQLSHCESLYTELYQDWYILDRMSRTLLADKVIKAAIPSSSTLSKERNRLITARDVAEDDDPEDEPVCRAGTPKKTDPNWYPGSESRAARLAEERRQAYRSSSPSKAPRTGSPIPIPSIEVVDYGDVSFQQLGNSNDGISDQDLEQGKCPQLHCSHMLGQLTFTGSSALPVNRTLFALPTPAPTPAPTQPGTHSGENLGEVTTPAASKEDCDELLARTISLYESLRATEQTLDTALANSSLNPLETLNVASDLGSVKGRLADLQGSMRAGLENDAELVLKYGRSAGVASDK